MYSFYTPAVGDQEAAAVQQALSAGELSTGSVVTEFEANVAALADRTYGVAVCSGSVALELAIRASDLQPGDRVIVSPVNCAAVLHSIRSAEMGVKFADIDGRTFNPSPTSVRELLETADPIDGLVITHLYGQPARVDELIELASEYDLTVIDDFCQAPGAMTESGIVGSFGTAGICSFGASKNITTGEGGMVVTDDQEIAEAVRTARSNNGTDTAAPVSSVRMSDIEAAIGTVQLDRYDSILAQKRRLAAIYRERLCQQVTPQLSRADTTHVYHRFAVRAPKRDRLLDWLTDHGIEARATITKPLYEYQCAPSHGDPQCPQAEAAMIEGLLLPMHTGLSSEDVVTITERINAFFETA